MITENEFFENEFIDYIYKGGFPELVNEKQESVISTYVRELVIKKIIYRDIPAFCFSNKSG